MSKTSTKKTEQHVAASADWNISPLVMYVLTAIAFIAYYFYSTISPGFYQHDELNHFINMREFWDRPEAILGNWAKAGYKIVYALPALLGSKFLVLVNCAVSALTCLLTYKTAQLLFDRKYALLAFIFVAAQPFWIELSFRNYADSFSGLVLLGAVFFHYRNQVFLSVLLLSYSTLIRQEFFLVAAVYGVYLLFRKKWIPAFSLAIFPVLYNFWGYALTGDILYLFTSTFETSSVYSEQFGKHGFFHFFKMSMVVFGAAQILLLVLFFTGLIREKISKGVPVFKVNPAFVWVPFAIYLFIHSLFNYEGMNLAASPNLRYMNGVSPLVGLMAAWALANWQSWKASRNTYLAVLGAFLFIALIFMTYKDNGVVFTEERNYRLWLMAVISFLLLLLPLKYNTQVVLFSAVAIIGGVLPLQPRKMGSEEKTMKNLTSWLVKNKKGTQEVITNHNLFYYFYEQEAKAVHPHIVSLDSAAIANAPVGSVVIIESHYSLRKDFPPPSRKILDEYLVTRDFNKAITDLVNSQNGNYVFAKDFISPDQRFGAIVLEKVK